jgi:hypothetical protein
MAGVAWRDSLVSSEEVACWELGPPVRERDDVLRHAETSSATILALAITNPSPIDFRDSCGMSGKTIK